LESFYTAFEAIPGENNLASSSIFFNKNLEDDITANMTNDDVKDVLNRKVDEAMISAFEVLRKRIDKFGVTQPNLQRLGKSGRILVELPGAKDIERTKDLITQTAQLEFWDVFKAEQFQSFFISADAKLKELVAPETTEATADTTDTEQSVVDDLLVDEEDVSDADPAISNPLLSKLSFGTPGYPVIGTVAPQDVAAVTEYLETPQVRQLLSNDLRYAKFVWGIPKSNVNSETNETVEYVELYALKRTSIEWWGGDRCSTVLRSIWSRFGRYADERKRRKGLGRTDRKCV